MTNTLPTTTRVTAKVIRRKRIGEMRVLYLFLLPAAVATLVFNYLPMAGQYIAFLDYDVFEKFMGFGSPFVGLENFIAIFQNPVAVASIWRTMLYSLATLAFGFVPPIILALLLNELRRLWFKKAIQTISYIPHFVSWVTVAGIVYAFMTVDRSGVVNDLKQALFGGERVVFMANPKVFLPLLVTTGVWKSVGWGSILYLAAITNISPELYEAASIDGASRWQKMVHITLPGLIATAVILLIFNLGNIFRFGFDQVFNLQNAAIQSQTYTIDVYQYYKGVKGQLYSFSAAVGLFQGVVAMILTLLANYFAKRTTNVGIV